MSIYICRGVNREYISQHKFRGHRTWHTIKKHKSLKAALRTAAESLAGNYKRARVLLTADYYDPVVIAEMNK